MSFLENRIPPPIIMLLIAAVMVRSCWQTIGMAEPLLWLLASSVFFLGAVVALAALRAFRRQQTTINPLTPERASSLVCSGVFAFSRNPMYLAMLLWLSAVALVAGIGWQWLGPMVFGLFINRFQIVPEERAMQKLFGKEYGEYSQQVSRWLGWRLNRN